MAPQSNLRSNQNKKKKRDEGAQMKAVQVDAPFMALKTLKTILKNNQTWELYNVQVYF